MISYCNVKKFKKVTGFVPKVKFEDSILKPTHFYANPGKYDVTLVDIDSLGCSDTTNKKI